VSLKFKFRVKVFWVVTLCSAVVGYQRFRRPWDLVSYRDTKRRQNPEDLDSNSLVEESLS